MNRKTNKMVELEEKIKGVENMIAGTNLLLEDLSKYEPSTGKAKEARDQELTALRELRNGHYSEKERMAEELELATVAMYAGKDTDFAEPTPADALRDAS